MSPPKPIRDTSLKGKFSIAQWGIITGMYTEFYERISAPWRANPALRGALRSVDLALRIAFALAYLGLLNWLAYQGDYPRLERAFFVPAITFVAVTALRNAINAPRPYEAYPIDAVIPKETTGKSMPSRHMASATIIACTLWWVSVPAGIVAAVGCAAIAYVRIAGGVHFPRDIAAAAAFSLACAAVGFLLIP